MKQHTRQCNQNVKALQDHPRWKVGTCATHAWTVVSEVQIESSDGLGNSSTPKKKRYSNSFLNSVHLSEKEKYTWFPWCNSTSWHQSSCDSEQQSLVESKGSHGVTKCSQAECSTGLFGSFFLHWALEHPNLQLSSPQTSFSGAGNETNEVQEILPLLLVPPLISKVPAILGYRVAQKAIAKQNEYCTFPQCDWMDEKSFKLRLDLITSGDRDEYLGLLGVSQHFWVAHTFLQVERKCMVCQLVGDRPLCSSVVVVARLFICCVLFSSLHSIGVGPWLWHNVRPNVTQTQTRHCTWRAPKNQFRYTYYTPFFHFLPIHLGLTSCDIIPRSETIWLNFTSSLDNEDLTQPPWHRWGLPVSARKTQDSPMHSKAFHDNSACPTSPPS